MFKNFKLIRSHAYLEQEEKDLQKKIEVMINNSSIVISSAKTAHEICCTPNYSRSVPMMTLTKKIHS